MKLLVFVSIISAILPIMMTQGEGEAAPEPPPPEPAPETPPTPPAAEATPSDTPMAPQEPVPATQNTAGEDLSGKSDMGMGRPGPENKKRDPTPWVCYQKVKPGPCQAYIKKWYYSKRSATCKQFIYGGCRGNSNSFWTKKDCEQFCKAKGSDMEIMARAYWVQGQEFEPRML